MIPLEPESKTPVAAEDNSFKSIPTLPPEASRDDVSSPDEEITPTPVLPTPVPEENILVQRPWMNELYSWNETYESPADVPKANRMGAYCVGNGHSFALVGLSTPLWTWSNLYGDSYQEPDLGQLRMTVLKEGSEIALSRQQIGWVKRSGIVKVKAQSENLSFETYDFAPFQDGPPGRNPSVLIRMVHVTNTGSSVQEGLSLDLRITPEWNMKVGRKTEKNDLVLIQGRTKVKRETVWRLGAFDPGASKLGDKDLTYRFPPLKPGGEIWAPFFLLSTDELEEGTAQAAKIRAQGALGLMDQTRAYFKEWFETGTEFTGDPKICDLFEIESTIFKCVQAHSGSFSPLIGYSYAWIRDNNGPIRWFLKTGHPEEAKRAIDFFHGVASSTGFLSNSVKVDIHLSYKHSDPSRIKVEHSETPDWAVLQHWWYYQTTGDLELIRSRWDYLKKCVFGQLNVDDRYFFQRDETYLWCLESRVFDRVPFPNYFLSTFAFSTDSSFELVSAADHLASLGNYLEMDKDVARLKKLSDRVRAKTTDNYWNSQEGYWAPAQSLLGPLYNGPFANILLNPFWCGYARNDLDPIGATPLENQRAVTAFQSAYPWLGRDDGFWKTTPTVDFYVGMNPGQLLYDFCQARLPWADRVYPAVLKTFTPSGDVAEMYDGDYRPWNRPVLGVGTSGRVRPWEGGLNTESVLEYLTGFAPDAGKNHVVFSPHIPEDMKEFNAQRLWVGPERVSLSLKRLDSKKWTATLHLDQGERLDVTLDFWASHRLLEDVATEESVAWDKTLTASSGREGRCSFPLTAGKDVSFTVSEASLLPKGEREPPKPQNFQAEPYEVSGGDLLLLTCPTANLNKHKYRYVDPADFVSEGKSEWDLVSGAAHSASFLDMDLPVSPEDVAQGLVDEKGNPKSKLAVLGRGVFSPGTHDFKPASFWDDSKLAKAFKSYFEKGGNVFLGPAYLQREEVPDWLTSLTDGGWDESDNYGEALAIGSASSGTTLKLLDDLDVGKAGMEKDHQVEIGGELYRDKLLLTDGTEGKKQIEDDGVGFDGSYAFTAKTEPGFEHRVWVRVNTGRNIKGLALQVKVGDEWMPSGVRTKAVEGPPRFITFFFPVAKNLISEKQTVFRLVSKKKEEVNAYHLWVYRDQPENERSLAAALGYAPGSVIGKADHGLVPHGKKWQVPVVLSKHPEEAAVIAQRIGKGWLIRSELSLEDSMPVIKTLLSNAQGEGPLSSFSGN